ncbi:ATP-binding protein [Oceanobacillus caeni]|uniref:ATP-binding domain of ThiL/HypE-like (N-terminal domain) family protein n=1 Tax=Oceanobacillus caeni TaxID=405946 RepID=A0ABR5MHN3_9BACI|nr:MULTISPECIES: hypothetical protein [Bacillaceae]KPH73537.1 hypothetical protein AFL42_12180 [Oceanobacillus caeni]MBU8790489.1 ATP-binding protein [Oceanobacillus caeni]MCR1835299.1 ATP-binding protein [Oceanobacillus caeni]MED4475052.1 ATP-binding protein [Oceanobacillus caeni]
MRDALIIPFNEQEELVMTTDNSGAIGLKEADAVKVPYEIVSYYSFRVAIVEALSSGAIPVSIVLQNFCGDEAWSNLNTGIQRGLAELGMENITLMGSTESNFSLSQSAIGVTIISKRQILSEMNMKTSDSNRVALIGLPLVGEEVITQEDDVVPLSVVKDICRMRDVQVWPVGSKGVLHELRRMVPSLDNGMVKNCTKLDLEKSGGPSTSILVKYSKGKESELRKVADKNFHRLWEGEV